MFPGDLSKSPHQRINGFFIFFGIGNCEIEISWPQSRFFFMILSNNIDTGRLKTMSRSSQNLT